jgi:hypothetical protein
MLILLMEVINEGTAEMAPGGMIHTHTTFHEDWYNSTNINISPQKCLSL